MDAIYVNCPVCGNLYRLHGDSGSCYNCGRYYYHYAGDELRQAFEMIGGKLFHAEAESHYRYTPRQIRARQIIIWWEQFKRFFNIE